MKNNSIFFDEKKNVKDLPPNYFLVLVCYGKKLNDLEM